MNAPKPPDIGVVVLSTDHGTKRGGPSILSDHKAQIVDDIKKYGKETALKKWKTVLKKSIFDLDKEYGVDGIGSIENISNIELFEGEDGHFFYTLDEHRYLGGYLMVQWNAGYSCGHIKEIVKDWLEEKSITIDQAESAMRYIDQLQEFDEARGRSNTGPKFVPRHELEKIGLHAPDIIVGDRDEQTIFDQSNQHTPIVVLRRLPFQYSTWDEMIDEINNKLDDEYMLSSHDDDTFTLIRIKDIG